MSVFNGLTIINSSDKSVAGYVLGYTDKKRNGVQISEVRPNGESTTYKIYPHRNDQVKMCRKKNGKRSCSTVTKKEFFAKDISKTEARALKLCSSAAEIELKRAERQVKTVKSNSDFNKLKEAVRRFKKAMSICEDMKSYAKGI
jgi:SpoVK/Ycf46/Vps4 family AAA+-type ATPase